MYDEILIPLDGSAFAEEVLPYGLGLARSLGAKLTLLRVAESEHELPAAEEYVQGVTRRLDAEGKIVPMWKDPGRTIVRELRQRPNALVAMTTHGHTGVLEAFLGSVAMGVVRHARRPVFIYRPRGGAVEGEPVREAKITRVVAPLDGSATSGRMLPYASELAKSLKARLTLVQVISPEISRQIQAASADVVESSYVHGRAKEIKRKHGIEADWEVLHGDPADAICGYLKGQQDAMLAMSTHTRAGLTDTIFGSVTVECVRRAGVPLLVYRPRRRRRRPETESGSA
jgi:nucleotide-binding universal stress UspA family protein